MPPPCTSSTAPLPPPLQNPPNVSHILAATMHLIPPEVLDAPPASSGAVLPQCSYAGMAEPADRAGFNQTLTALKRAALSSAATTGGHKRAAVLTTALKSRAD